MQRVNRRLILPALTAQLRTDFGLATRNGVRDTLGQIKIATNATLIRTVNAKHRLSSFEVGSELKLAAGRSAIRAEVSDINGDGLQLRELAGQRRCGVDPLGNLFPVFETRTILGTVIHVSLSVDWYTDNIPRKRPLSVTIAFPDAFVLLCRKTGVRLDCGR